MKYEIGGHKFDPHASLVALDRVECAESLAAFVAQAWHIVEPGQDYVHGWHIDAMAEHLEAITYGDEDYNRLLINIPPGHMKSLMVGVFWPAWEWGPCNLPHMRYLCASHSLELGIRDSMRMRRLITSDWYQARWPHVKLTADQNQKTKFENTATGFRQAVAAGSITGSRGDRVICLPYDSLVLSDIGWLPIGEIVERQLDVKIAGVGDHGIEWQPIEAYERNPARPIVRIECDGTALECTEDHRVFVRGRGWIAAADIVPGDCVFLADNDQLRALRETRPAQKESDKILREILLPGAPKKDFRNTQHGALCELFEASLSPTGAPQTMQRGVLFDGLRVNNKDGRIQSNVERRKGDDGLPPLRESIYPPPVRSQAGAVVFHEVRVSGGMGSARREIDPAGMRAVRQEFPTKQPEYQNVFQRMRGEGAFQENEGRKERSICSWRSYEVVSAGLDAHLQEANQATRWYEVHALSANSEGVGADASCASHRLQQRQFSAFEPDNTLQMVPWQNAREFGKSCELVASIVRSVVRTNRVVEHTYNVRVAPCHNYFAGGVLVHNCDDPHSVEGASSDQQRRSTLEWFLEAVPTRLNNPDRSAIVVIMQRLHEEDVSGVILDKQLGYDHLCLPMRATLWRKDFPTKIGFVDPRTEEGELLFPARFPQSVVDRDERVMGAYATAGQFQQEPVPRGGGIIKRDWWKPYMASEEYPPMEMVVASLDTAYTEKSENDYSALTVWGVFSGLSAQVATRWSTPGGRLLDQGEQNWRFDEAAAVKTGVVQSGGNLPSVMLMAAWQERLQIHDLVEKVAKTCRRMQVDTLLIEDKAAGHSVAQELRRLFAHERWSVRLVNPGRIDKVARVHSISHLFEEGLVFAPDKEWADMVIQQVSVFPRGKHDDLVDTVAQAMRHLRDIGALTRAPEWAEQTYESMVHKGRAPEPIYPV